MTKKILLTLGGLAVVIAIISLVHGFGVLNAVTLAPSNGVTLELGQIGSVGMGKSIVKTSSAKTVHVSAGTYAVVFSKPGYNPILTEVTVTGNKQITSPILYPNPANLAAVLNENATTIHSAVAAAIPVGYSIADEQLLGDGSWYGASLASADTSQDTLRIIAHKNGNTWTVSAGPSIIIPAANFGGIPADVISAVNNTL